MRKPHTFLAAAILACAAGVAGSMPARATTHPEILVTGFEPFGGDPVNPSWEAIKDLDGQVIEGYQIKCVRLPVDYRQVRRILDKLIPQEKPAAYIALGEDAGWEEVRLEQDAVDHVDPNIPDSAGFEETKTHLRRHGAPVYHSTLPIDALATLLSNAGVTVERSTDAGSYVCDFTFYNARYLIEKNHLSTEMGFIHLPAVGHPWSVEQLAKVGRDIVTVVARSLESDPGLPPLVLPAFDEDDTAPVASGDVGTVTTATSAVDSVAGVASDQAPAMGIVGALAQDQ